MSNRAVLISGCSSGIGKAMALELDRQGYKFFSGVRKQEDSDSLRALASGSLAPVILDVTKPDTIVATCEQVKSHADGKLFCLVNNAGISIGGALELLPINEFRRQMEVNLVGQLALTQACLPMIRSMCGRIIFVSSVSGRMGAPFNGAYGASKAALIAIADAMRIELKPWQIGVSVLIVDSVKTPIWEKSARLASAIAHSQPADRWLLYKEQQKHAGAFYMQVGSHGVAVEQVSHVVSRLLKSRRPKEYVLIGQEPIMIEMMDKLLPVRWRDWLFRWQMGLLKP